MNKEIITHHDEAQCPHCWNEFTMTWEALLEEHDIDWQEAFDYIWACPICSKPTRITNEEYENGDIEIAPIGREEWFNKGYMEMYNRQIGK